MRLTTFSDYALRVLIYLGVREGEVCTVAGIAGAYGISANHLMKVVHHLGQHGYVETLRGKGGGMRLAREPARINLGELVRGTEEQRIVECFDSASSACRIESACALRGILGEALEAFFTVLDRHTLADLLQPSRKLARILVFRPPQRAAAARREPR
ncbi:MAG TPA: Rrf2 family transcriptional regulator [Usitatibacter sp.]|nr:Rrf2 family transcriptional regulator [Usitatibacter sp.]